MEVDFLGQKQEDPKGKEGKKGQFQGYCGKADGDTDRETAGKKGATTQEARTP